MAEDLEEEEDGGQREQGREGAGGEVGGAAEIDPGAEDHSINWRPVAGGRRRTSRPRQRGGALSKPMAGGGSRTMPLGICIRPLSGWSRPVAT